MKASLSECPVTKRPLPMMVGPSGMDRPRSIGKLCVKIIWPLEGTRGAASAACYLDLKVKDLMDVVDSVHALADHTMEYAAVTARYAAAATPEQWAEADALAHRGLDKDVETIQDRTLTASGLREPFKTVWLRIAGQPETADP